MGILLWRKTGLALVAAAMTSFAGERLEVNVLEPSGAHAEEPAAEPTDLRPSIWSKIRMGRGVSNRLLRASNAAPMGPIPGAGGS